MNDRSRDCKTSPGLRTFCLDGCRRLRPLGLGVGGVSGSMIHSGVQYWRFVLVEVPLPYTVPSMVRNLNFLFGLLLLSSTAMICERGGSRLRPNRSGISFLRFT